MKEAGIDVLRVSDLAWSKLEPENAISGVPVHGDTMIEGLDVLFLLSKRSSNERGEGAFHFFK